MNNSMMNELKRNSIHFSNNKCVACWPQFGNKKEIIDVSSIASHFDGAYSTNNSTICFVVDHEVYVTPYTREAIRTLSNEGLEKGLFYVPFSNGDFPVDAEFKWCHLRELATESYYQDYEEDSARWCDQHGIGELSEETLARCFRIPRSGVPVKHLYFEDTYYPACGERCLDCTAVDYLGRYCTNNGIVTFVYHDGHTYVAFGYWILGELQKSGYRKGGLFVPFSNGEQITDPILAKKWEQITK